MTAGIFFFLRDVFVSVNILLLCRYFLGFELRKRRAAGIVTAVLFALNSAAYTYGSFTPSVGETTDIVTVFEGDMVKPFEIGKANVLREGKDVAIFATGLMVNESLMAAEALASDGIDAAVINIHTIKPIDAACVTEWAEKCGKVITVEEHSVIGGLGDAVADVLMGKVNCKFHKIGVNDRFGQSGKAADVLREYGLTADQIAETVKANI